MKSILRKLLPVVPAALFGFALWFLHHELKSAHYTDVVRHLSALPPRALLLGLLFTALSYFFLIGYDLLGFRYAGRSLEAGKIALTSFISYAFSNSIGHSVLTGGSVRYRLYSSWKVSGEDISKVIAATAVTFWLGLLFLGSFFFLTEPVAFPPSSVGHYISPPVLGGLFIAILVAYFALLVAGRGSSFAVRGWSVPVPSVATGVGQVIVSSLDWTVSAAVVYVLLPPSPGLTFPFFLAVYLLAMFFAILSQVPAGAAVFETLVVVLLGDLVPAPSVIGALLVYRFLYCLLPLALAALLFGAREIVQRREKFRPWLEIVGVVLPGIAPTLFSLAAFLGGTILLLSGATPAVPSRLRWLDNILPLGVIEASHFIGSLAGAGLLLLARGLQRRLRSAYELTVVVLLLGIAGSMLKGLDYEEAAILAVILGTLWLCRENFYRRAVLQSEQFTPAWTLSILMVIGGSIWLGLFAHKQVDYSHDLWWHFSLRGDAPRFLRASVGAVGLTVFAMAAMLLRPAEPEPHRPSPDDLAAARAIALKSARTTANLALLGDKSILFNEARTAFLMFGIQGRSWVAMGDPVGPPEERAELAWRFREMSDEHDGWVVFYEVSTENLPLYVDLGLTLLKLGEEARVPLTGFSLQGSQRKGLRYTVAQVEKHGCAFDVVPPDGVPALFPELKDVSDAWLTSKRAREKGFSLGFYDESYLRNFPVGVVRKEGRVVAFANLWPSDAKDELSIDLMRYRPDAPPNLMEYLFTKLMVHGAAEGYRWFNLGMAPLSGLGNRALAPLWNKAGNWLFRNGEDFYNFEGLRQYKEKFHPVWEPKYLAAPSGFRLPAIFANVSTLISGGLGGLLPR